jgi:hypothetical protein
MTKNKSGADVVVETQTKAAKIVDKMLEKYGDEETVAVLSNGIVLRAKQVKPLLIMQAVARFTPPPVPTYFDESYGKEMQNPNDPDYIIAKQHYQITMSNAQSDVLLLLGTEYVDAPKELGGGKKNPPWTYDDWYEELQALNIELHLESASWRKLQWLKTVAMDNEHDLNAVVTAVGRLSGVAEADVEAAQAPLP